MVEVQAHGFTFEKWVRDTFFSGCCHSPAERFVRVTGADWTRLGDAAERLAHFIGRGNEAYMRMTNGHCAALEVRLDANHQPEHFCTIYERRPQICRDLARGSPECAGERARGAFV